MKHASKIIQLNLSEINKPPDKPFYVFSILSDHFINKTKCDSSKKARQIRTPLKLLFNKGS